MTRGARYRYGIPSQDNIAGNNRLFSLPALRPAIHSIPEENVSGNAFKRIPAAGCFWKFSHIKEKRKLPPLEVSSFQTVRQEIHAPFVQSCIYLITFSPISLSHHLINLPVKSAEITVPAPIPNIGFPVTALIASDTRIIDRSKQFFIM